MDNTNDTTARNFVMNSLEPALFEDIRNKSRSLDNFATTWLMIIHHIVTISVTRFDNLKKRTSSTIPSQISCQDIEAMSKIVKRLGKEVKSSGYFQHSLTLDAIKNLLKSDGPDMYKFTMISLQKTVEEAIQHCAFMSKEDANRYMKKEQIDFVTMCDTTESRFKTARDNGEWKPYKLPTDGKMLQLYLSLHLHLVNLTLLGNLSCYFRTKILIPILTVKRKRLCVLGLVKRDISSQTTLDVVKFEKVVRVPMVIKEETRKVLQV